MVLKSINNILKFREDISSWESNSESLIYLGKNTVSSSNLSDCFPDMLYMSK